MTIIRPHEEAFAGLPDYSFDAHFVEVGAGALRMHYVDEGPRDAAPVLMLHGEPTWSYLYRHMIPVCAQAGHRVIAPDLIGFGKSDKLTDRRAYSYAGHVAWMTEFIERLDLRDVRLFGQDWGALIGLRLAAEQSARFARIVIGNGMLPLGGKPALANALAFGAWRAFATSTPVLPISRIVDVGTRRKLTAEERAAYEAPFGASGSKAGARAFPGLVPTRRSDPAVPANLAAWEVLGRWDKPLLTVFSTGDPIMRGFDKVLQRHVPGAAGLPHATVRGGHFLQEDAGPEIAGHINELITST